MDGSSYEVTRHRFCRPSQLLQAAVMARSLLWQWISWYPGKTLSP